jgi:plastocyanin
MFAAVAIALTLGACSSNKSATTTTATPSTSATTTTSTTSSPTQSTTATTTASGLSGPSDSEIDESSSVTIAGKSVKVPTDGGQPISSVIDEGQQIIISAAGFMPARLYSSPGQAIVWTNLTNESQKITFDAFSVKSPAIPPGGTWSWTTNDSESIAYHSASGLKAVVTVNPAGLG